MLPDLVEQQLLEKGGTFSITYEKDGDKWTSELSLQGDSVGSLYFSTPTNSDYSIQGLARSLEAVPEETVEEPTEDTSE